MDAMSDEQLERGVKALRDGDKRTARRVFGQVVGGDPDNLAAWWYLAAVLDDPEQKTHCLRQVLRLRPDHVEATRMLSQLQRRFGQATPSTGTKRPAIVDAQEAGDGLAVVPERREEKQVETGTESEPAAPSSDVTVLAAAVLIALAAIVGAVILVWTGAASEVLGIRGPDLSPTARALTFDVKACVTTEVETATLVFINNTGVTIDVLRGPQGEEEFLLTLTPDELGDIEASPGVPTRYAVSTEAEGVVGGGAIIEVPVGSTCRVPIQ